MAYKEPAEITIENLKSKIKHYYPNDTAIILRAFKLAQDAHEGQYRASGRPYITHPCVVCDILIDLGFDVATLCAALLHDTVEDTYVTDAQLREEFGEEIAEMVEGRTPVASARSFWFISFIASSTFVRNLIIIASPPSGILSRKAFLCNCFREKIWIFSNKITI